MSKKALTAITIFALLGLLVAGMQTVEVAKANFIILPTKPITDPPTLIVQSPTNNYSYSETAVPLNITITKPASWGPSGNASIYYDCGISYIHYILDGTSHSLFQAQLINPIPQDLLPTISNFSERLKGLTNGAHSLQITIYALSQWCPDNSGPYGTSVPPFYFHNMTVTSETIRFTVGLQATSSSSPTETPTPVMTASLSESASALNYGNRVNFTISVEGGQAPYTYAWFIDNESVENNSSPYYATNNSAVGSHHVYVQVTDADNNSATTLTVEFNILPFSSSSPSSSASSSNSPTQQPTTATTPPIHSTPSPNYTLIIIIVGVVLAIVAIAGAIVYFKRIKK
jgi:hypothetical protein